MATVRWLGAAQDIQQVTTYTITGTWAANDTCSLKINNKVLTLTLGTDIATTDVAAELAAMINARSATAGRTGANADEIRNFGGQEIAEWTEVVASASGSVLTLKSTAGVPVTITCTQNTGGGRDGAIEGATDGVFQAGTTVTAATGKHFFNNADNWEGGSLPSAGDTLLFDQGAVDVLYGLNETSVINNLSIIRTNGYSGNIGLLPVNSLGYIEYRTRYLNLPNSSGNQDLLIGDANPVLPAVGRTYIDLGAGTTTYLNLEVFDAPAKNSSTGYPVQIIRGKKIELFVYSGGVSVGCNEGTSTNSELLSVYVEGDATLELGSYSQLNSGATVEVINGSLHAMGTVADATVDVTVRGGTLNSRLSAIDALSCHGGTTIIGEATVTSALVYGGATLKEGSRSATITNLTLYRGSSLAHPNNILILTNGIDFSGCRPSDVSWTPPQHLTWTPSAI